MGTCRSAGVDRKAQSPAALEEDDGPLPDDPDPALSEAYTCSVLHTTKGLLRGSWGRFEAKAFYRPLPGDAVATLRHLMIEALDISTYAEREGETVRVDALGEGSYSRVFGMHRVAAKIISDRERPWVHRAAVENTIQADRLGVGPRFYGHGTLEQTLGGRFGGTVLLMERLDPQGDAWSEADSAALLRDVARLSRTAFHNDLKPDNVLRRHGTPVIIDFDLMAAWTIKVAVTTSCIEHDFRDFMQSRTEDQAAHFREYYDLFNLSLRLEDGPLYRTVFRRLEALWASLEAPVLRPLFESLTPDALREIPIEVMVRVPIQGVTVNLFDLRGNLFAHLPDPEGDPPGGEHAALPESCRALPQLARSNGVYWPS